MTVVSLLTPSFVARQVGYALEGDWMVGDRATNEHYAPLETFEKRFGELLALTRSLGFEAIDLWTAHLGPGWASDEHLAIARALLEDHDLTVVSLAGGFGGTAEELRATCRVAHGVGTDLLRCGRAGETRDHHRRCGEGDPRHDTHAPPAIRFHISSPHRPRRLVVDLPRRLNSTPGNLLEPDSISTLNADKR